MNSPISTTAKGTRYTVLKGPPATITVFVGSRQKTTQIGNLDVEQLADLMASELALKTHL